MENMQNEYESRMNLSVLNEVKTPACANYYAGVFRFILQRAGWIAHPQFL